MARDLPSSGEPGSFLLSTDSHRQFASTDLLGAGQVSAYGPMWDAARSEAGYRDLGGRLSVSMSDGQLVSLGRELSDGATGDALWAGMAARAGGVMDGKIFFNDLGLEDYSEDPFDDSFALEGEGAHIASRYDLDHRELTDLFRGVTSPAEFRKLTPAQQAVFIEAVALSSSGANSPFEALAAVAELDSSQARSAGFQAIVERTSNLVLDARPTEFASNRPGNPGPLPSIEENPTVELVRFLSEQTASETATALLGQTRFEGQLPPRVQAAIGRDMEHLDALAGDNYKRNLLGLRVDAHDMTGAIVGAAYLEGSQGAWAFMDRHEVDPTEIFARLGDDNKDQVMRSLLIDALGPGAADRGGEAAELIAAQRIKLEDWRARL
jgi:hypothetical protein